MNVKAKGYVLGVIAAATYGMNPLFALPLYEAELLTTDEYIERFMAPAGLTGLWQVEKRGNQGALSAEERKQLDIKYARNFSFGNDIKIICKTFTAFVQKENV